MPVARLIEPGLYRVGSSNQIQDALYRVLRSMIFKEDPRSPLNDLPYSQLRVLNAVAEHQGLKMQDICEALDMKLPAMSQIVNRLVKKEMLERVTDVRDRRAILLHLTPLARQAVDEARALRDARMSQILEMMAPEEREKVAEGLALLAQAAAKAEQPGDSVAEASS